jgi:hypothetical protein
MNSLVASTDQGGGKRRAFIHAATSQRNNYARSYAPDQKAKQDDNYRKNCQQHRSHRDVPFRAMPPGCRAMVTGPFRGDFGK